MAVKVLGMKSQSLGRRTGRGCVHILYLSGWVLGFMLLAAAAVPAYGKWLDWLVGFVVG